MKHVLHTEEAERLMVASYKITFFEFSFTTTIFTLLLVAFWYTGTMEPRRKIAACAIVRG